MTTVAQWTWSWALMAATLLTILVVSFAAGAAMGRLAGQVFRDRGVRDFLAVATGIAVSVAGLAAALAVGSM